MQVEVTLRIYTENLSLWKEYDIQDIKELDTDYYSFTYKDKVDCPEYEDWDDDAGKILTVQYEDLDNTISEHLNPIDSESVYEILNYKY